MSTNGTGGRPFHRRSRCVGYVFRDRRGKREEVTDQSGKKQTKRKWASNGFWSIAFEDVDGRLRRERTNARTRTLADRILADRQDAVERARLQELGSVDDLLKPKPAPTLRQFSKEYLEGAKSRLKEKTYDRSKNILDVHLLPKLGNVVLSRCTPGDVQRYSDTRLKEGAKPGTVVRELITLSAIFTDARKREIVDRNPVSLITKPTINNSIVRYLDEKEEEELLARLSEPLRTAVVVAIHSGLREGEELNLKWPDLNFKQRLITVRNTKSHRDRVVPMNQTLFEALDSIDRHISSPYVFTNTETGERYDRFNNTAWRNALENAGIRNFRWHDLRHTCASRMVQKGVPLTSVKEILGHSSIAVTQRYAHLAPANLRDAVRALDGRAEVQMLEVPRPKKSRERKAGG